MINGKVQGIPREGTFHYQFTPTATNAAQSSTDETHSKAGRHQDVISLEQSFEMARDPTTDKSDFRIILQGHQEYC